MYSLFIDQKKQIEFEEKGYLVLPLLSGEQVYELKALYESTHSQHAVINNLHHTTTDTQDTELIYQIDTDVKRIFSQALDHHLVNYKALAATFHIKEPGKGSATGLHQDPTFVDETQYISANVWVALQDTNENNGNLYFAEGSNKAIYSLRITPASPNYYQSFIDELRLLVKQVPLKKGEAVIFSNATIHGATENLSPNVRLAATLLICSAPAQWLFYYRDKDQPDGEIEKYHLTLEEFVAMQKTGKPSALALSEKIRYEFPSLSLAEYQNRIAEINPKKKTLARLFDFFTAR